MPEDGEKFRVLEDSGLGPGTLASGQPQSSMTSGDGEPCYSVSGDNQPNNVQSGSFIRPILTTIFLVFMMFFGISKLSHFDASNKNLTPGFALMLQDQFVEAKNYTFKFPHGTQAVRLLVWDFAAEDGDMVSIVVNGQPIGEPFTIYHKPKEIIVPLGQMRIIGTKDGGGGGVTYAVNFPDLNQSVPNGIPEGGSNIYSLELKP